MSIRFCAARNNHFQQTHVITDNTTVQGEYYMKVISLSRRYVRKIGCS